MPHEVPPDAIRCNIMVLRLNPASGDIDDKIKKRINNKCDFPDMYYDLKKGKGILEDIPIVLSSMVTGQRQLDNYNYLRLKREIEECIRIKVIKNVHKPRKVFRFSKPCR